MAAGMIAGIALFKKPLEDAYSAAKDATKQKIKRWSISKNIKKIQRKISAVEKVKTIWQIDQPINLKEFYHAPRISIDKKTYRINRVKDLAANTVVIQGIAGQGKSIFLRYLCSQENVAGDRIPIFIELRRLGVNESLLDFLVASVRAYGFEDLDASDFLFLCRSGALILLLDGFDEIEPVNAAKIITEIERLSEQGGDELTIVVTCRPDGGIERSAKFRVVRLLPLTPQEIPSILEKLCPEASVRNNIINAINAAGTRIRSLLTTPLMVTLLLLVYKSEQKIPDEFSAFYESLFWILLIRHDRSKPGFVRKRRSSLSDTELKAVFESFCYLSRRYGFSKFSGGQALEVVAKAAETVNMKVDASAFLDDIIKVTCLLLEESLAIFFIHRTVQEYFASSYISKRPHQAIVGFYAALGAEGRWSKWRQELLFLSQIDRYRYLKHFFLPDAYASLEFFGANLPELGDNWRKEQAWELLSDISVSIRGDSIVEYELSLPHNFMALSSIKDDLTEDFVLGLFMSKENDVVRRFSRDPLADSGNLESPIARISAIDVLNALGAEKLFLEQARKCIDKLIVQVTDANAFITQEDKSVDILDIQ